MIVQVLLIALATVKAEKVLITGGAGFIGYHTALKLRQSNIPVIVLDNFNNDYDVSLKKARAVKLKESDVTIHDGNAKDNHIINYIIKHNTDISGIVHCAAFTSIKGNIENPIKSVEDNIETVVSILDVLSKHQEVKAQFVYMSSSVVYDEDQPLPYSVNNPLSNPKHLFAAMKLSIESLVDGYSNEYGINSVGLRLFSVYGPWSRPGTLMFDLAKSIANNGALNVPHEGDTPISRDFIYIDDVVESISLALKYPFTAQRHHTIFNIASGKPTPVTTVINSLKSLSSNPAVKINKVALNTTDALKEYADISSTTSLLKLVRKVDLDEGIKRFVQWFKKYLKNEIKKGEKFDNSIGHKSFDEYIQDKNKAFIKRIGDLRENYTAYAEAHNIPVAKFYRYKEFKFHPGFDSGGNRHTMNSLSVEKLKEICITIDECIAFTPGGGFKSFIEPQSKWNKGGGMYVANVDMCKAGLHNCFGNSTCTYLGPAQFECGCHEGFGLYKGKCIELYKEGRFSQAEADEKLADYIDGREWKKYIQGNAGKYVRIPNKDEHIIFGELLYYPEAKGNVEKLKDACTKSYHCIGFSTSGVLKKAIDQPKRWKHSGDSMYLLDVDYCSLDPFRCPPHSSCRKQKPGYWSC